MKRLIFTVAALAVSSSYASAASYYCVTETDGWRYDAFNINPADLDQTVATVDPLSRWLYVSCMGTIADATGKLTLDCAILDDEPSNVLAHGQIDDGEQTLTVATTYDGRQQSVTCTKRRSPRLQDGGAFN